jgi:Ca-activated chloride channel homolog
MMVALWFWARVQGRKSMKSLVAERLAGELVTQHSTLRSLLTFFLQLSALAALILAMAGPRYGEESIEATERGRSVLIALDTLHERR